MERDELGAWLRLTLAPGIGNESARRLLAAFGLPTAILEQSPAALQQLLSPKQTQALQEKPDGLAELLDRSWTWLQEAPQQRAIVPWVTRATRSLCSISKTRPCCSTWLDGSTCPSTPDAAWPWSAAATRPRRAP